MAEGDEAIKIFNVNLTAVLVFWFLVCGAKQGLERWGVISFALKNLTSMPPNTFNFTVDYGLLVHDYPQMCAPLFCKFPVKVYKGFWKTF